jgi:hypothetical protein
MLFPSTRLPVWASRRMTCPVCDTAPTTGPMRTGLRSKAPVARKPQAFTPPTLPPATWAKITRHAAAENEQVVEQHRLGAHVAAVFCRLTMVQVWVFHREDPPSLTA